MNTVRYIIIEDESLAMQQLQAMIKAARPHWQSVFTAGSIEEALPYFEAGNNPDLCFMDVELGDGNIFELFKSVRIDSPVIFTTAYDQYSLDAFSTNAVGYVLKPLSPAELRDAIEKYERSWGRQQELHKIYNTMAASTPQPSSPRRVLTSAGDKFGYEDIDNIAWFVSEDKYVFAITVDGRRCMTTMHSLQDVESITEGYDFFRLSRAIICSIKAIGNIHRYFKGRLKVELTAGQIAVEETVSAARRGEFLEWVGGNSAV